MELVKIGVVRAVVTDAEASWPGVLAVPRRAGVPGSGDGLGVVDEEDVARDVVVRVEDGQRLARVAERLEVPRRRPIAKLSKGQAASALLALAFAAEPELLLLDEPFSGLDAVARDELLGIFLHELELDGRAVLLTTHDLDLGSRIADRVVLLSEGRFEDRPDLAGAEPNPTELRRLVAGDMEEAA